MASSYYMVVCFFLPGFPFGLGIETAAFDLFPKSLRLFVFLGLPGLLLTGISASSSFLMIGSIF